MDIERESRHHHQGADGAPCLSRQEGQDYELNLIDTPGHVDSPTR